MTPNLIAMAREAATATGDDRDTIRERFADAAVKEILALGWDAPHSMLRAVQEVQAARRADQPTILGFDEHGNGPFCQHGQIPIFCGACSRLENAIDALVMVVTKAVQP